MNSAAPDRITIRTFSSIFEKMCNFIAIAKTGDPHATIRGLVTLCLFEFPDEQFYVSGQFHKTIETLFGLVIPQDQIESALDELEKQNVIIRPGNTNYRLDPAAMEELKQSIEEAQSLEERVRVDWFQQLGDSYPNLPVEDAWEVLRAYLQKTFRRHGIQAAALLDPTVNTPPEHEASLTAILHKAIDEHGFLDKNLRARVEAAVSGFMAALGRDTDRIKYIAQLADAAFNFYTLEVPADLSEHLRKELRELTLFLDTNFLFGILDLHYNTQVQVSHDLMRAISEHKLPFKLRFHEETQKEISNTISHYGSILRSRPWTNSLSRAASTSRNLSGIEQKFHERNAAGPIDVDEFLRPFEHVDSLLATKDIKIYRPHSERPNDQNDLFHEYREFLDKNGRGDKPYETVMHDVKVLEETRNLRTNAASSLEAGALLISCDYYLYRFDWEASRKVGRRACVLLPNIFWQILRPFVPTDQDFEKAFAETFALPEFRVIGSGGSRACSKMLQILATYKEVPEQTAMKMLANDLLLDRLRSEHDDAKFKEQVEQAFVEENRNLLEEKMSLEQELQRQKVRAEEEARKRQEDKAAYEANTNELNKGIEEAGQQLEAASRALKEHDQAKIGAEELAKAAGKSAAEAQRKAEEESDHKRKAERKAFCMSVFAGIAFGGIAVIIFLALTHMLPWPWLVSHKNTIPLQIAFWAAFMCASLGLFVGAWRKWCWGGGLVAFVISLLSLMGT
ncbi:cell envelope integrity protein TolA [Mesotoga sp. BH458_6_3_2_1]|uniref:cell envelope integrity protein TolA n=1 Tax=Mesotoga sp. BH458_6_3_2_1 TaxID=1437446 RepID=UPI000EF21BC1|nr:cell envelope integrity protein TolA [Mesotoga sp. BH458_6_3_2_1]RLL81547.1 hypothetical protein Y697_12495 [Mesotoga sp. BH458_6_3_2_1]